MMIRLLLGLGASAIAASVASPLLAQHRVPARFEAGRVSVDLPIEGGETLRMYTDSGGGGAIIFEPAARRLRLATTPMPPEETGELGPGTAIATCPPRLRDPALPAFPERTLVAREFPHFDPATVDGFLGQSWFAGRVWTWDYPSGTLTIEPTGWVPPANARTVPVTFRQKANGQRASNFPRIVVRIDGADVPMLFDTGAMTVLSPAALEAVADGGPAQRATSIVTASVIARWRERHPDWTVIEAAQVGTGARMIRVPAVQVGDLSTGPVWFTERPDANFRDFMSSMMAAPVEGAIGGNAFADLRVTLDYPGARAVLVRVARR